MNTLQSTPYAVMIVEDESVVAMDLEASLKQLGYSICGWATSGKQALDEIRRGHPDLVLMDIQLQTIRIIRILEQAISFG